MSRYIDADRLQQTYKEIHGGKRSLLIDTEPTADVRENVKGEWIEQEDDYYHYWECSECGFGVGLDDIRNYCPNCGADMRQVTGKLENNDNSTNPTC